MALFGNRASAGVLKLGCDHNGSEWALNPRTGVIRGRDTQAHRETPRDAQVETGVMPPQARDHQKPAETGGTLPWAFRGNPALLGLRTKTFLLFKSLVHDT